MLLEYDEYNNSSSDGEKRGSRVAIWLFILIVSIISITGGWIYYSGKSVIEKKEKPTKEYTLDDYFVSESDACDIARDYVLDHYDDENFNRTAFPEHSSDSDYFQIRVSGFTSDGSIDYHVKVSKTGEVVSVQIDEEIDEEIDEDEY